MKIQSKLNRIGGTVISLGNDEYHFKDDGNGNHIAEVTDKAHIEKLLAIKEGYHEFGKKPGKEPEAPQSPEENKLPDNVDEWTNKQCNDWATALKLNPLNKSVLIDYAESKGIKEIDELLAPAEIIRLIAKNVLQ